MPIVESAAVTGGVTTHAEVFVVAALDDVGGPLGVEKFPLTPAGCQALLDWLAAFGPVRLVGIDTIDAWGGWLARHLQHAGVVVVVVGPLEGPRGRDEPVERDAVGTAWAARSGNGRALAAVCDPMLEAIGVLLVARRSAERDRTAAVMRIRALLAAAPGDVGLGLFHHSPVSLIAETAALRPRPGHPVGYATRVALRELGDRAAYLDGQIGRLDELLVPLVAAHAAGLVATFAQSADSAATLLAAVDDTTEA